MTLAGDFSVNVQPDGLRGDVYKRQGMDAHIAKPIDVNILYETLTQVMGREA